MTSAVNEQTLNGARSINGAPPTATPLSLFEALWSTEAPSGCDPPARLFLDLAIDDAATRERRLERLETNLKQIVRHWQKIADDGKKTGGDAKQLGSSVSTAATLFQFCLLSLHRLALTCPFLDAAEFFRRQLSTLVSTTPKSLITIAARRSFTVGNVVEFVKCDAESNPLCSAMSPSHPNTSLTSSSSSSSSLAIVSTASVYIPNSELPSFTEDDPSESDSDDLISPASLFHFRFSTGVGGGVAGAASFSRLDNLSRLLAAHPSYFQAFLRTEEQLMSTANNPLGADQAR